MNSLAILEPMFILLAVSSLFAIIWLNIALLTAHTEQQKEAEAAHLINR